MKFFNVKKLLLMSFATLSLVQEANSASLLKVLNITKYVKNINGNIPAAIWTSVGDPAPGVLKNLVVYYTDATPTKTYTDTDLVNATTIPNADKIANVYYGISADIQSLVPKLITNKKVLNITGYVKNINGNIPAVIWAYVGDPAPGVLKNLVVYYTDATPKKTYTDTDLVNAMIIPNADKIANVYYGMPADIQSLVPTSAVAPVVAPAFVAVPMVAPAPAISTGSVGVTQAGITATYKRLASDSTIIPVDVAGWTLTGTTLKVRLTMDPVYKKYVLLGRGAPINIKVNLPNGKIGNCTLSASMYYFSRNKSNESGMATTIYDDPYLTVNFDANGNVIDVYNSN